MSNVIIRIWYKECVLTVFGERDDFQHFTIT